MAVRLVRLDLYHVRVPLRSSIKHASHAREASDNVVVAATLSDGSVGHGEGVPRDYVTGETVESVWAALRGYDAARAYGVVDSVATLAERVGGLAVPVDGPDPRGMRTNSARCALELAILDATTRSLGVGLDAAIAAMPEGREHRAATPAGVRYSGAITSGPWYDEHLATWKHRIYGFRDVKVKVGVAGQNDKRRMWYFRTVLGKHVDIRIDANEAWRVDELESRVRPLLKYRPSLLEQPVPHGELEALAARRPDLEGVPVLLDESLCGLPDGERAIAHGYPYAFNVRLSKCGGVGPSLRLMDLAWRHGLPVQLGCHPGETGILSAAGRRVACIHPKIRYLEGSYDRFVLRDNVIVEDITFGYGGNAPPLSGPGLGVTVDPAKLERLTVRHEEVRFE